MDRWIHIVYTNEGFYVDGSLVGAIVDLAGYQITGIKAFNECEIWLKLKGKKNV